MGNSGCFPKGKSAATESHYPACCLIPNASVWGGWGMGGFVQSCAEKASLPCCCGLS